MLSPLPVVHSWFGNYVTMTYYDYLWLKEGFATYLSYVGTDQVCEMLIHSQLNSNIPQYFYHRSNQIGSILNPSLFRK